MNKSRRPAPRQTPVPPPPGLIIAAPQTGAGKTTVTLGLLRALSAAGLRVNPFKIGPDYIDPKFHEAAAGRPCFNLDSWAMRAGLLRHLIAQASEDCDLILAEGVMGLFDGASTAGIHGNGSTAEMARMTRWPVILVVNCSGIGQSVGAMISGFAGFDPDITIAGVILNRVASPRHEAVLRAGLQRLAVPVIGIIPASAEMALPSRHLGLVQAGEHDDLEQIIADTAAAISKGCDLSQLTALAAPTELPSISEPPNSAQLSLPPLGQSIAIAKDAAFGFSYNHLGAAWRAAGCEIRYFSPLANQPPPTDADAIFLPGGYPELHAERLAGADRFLTGLRRAADKDCVIYGECGGYMALGEGLEDRDGKRHAMAGLLPLETSFARRKLHLGYRHLTCASRFAGLPAGSRLTAHEFHYATVTRSGPAEALFSLAETNHPAGLRHGKTAGSFMHLIDIAET